MAMPHRRYFQRYGKVRLAPMMGYTTRHMRKLMRLISTDILNCTEMISVNAVIHGDGNRHLLMASGEGPTCLQLGGSDPRALARVVGREDARRFSEININAGCPSCRVNAGRFGACLMREPELLAELVCAAKNSCILPVTVKHRIGINGDDDYARLYSLINRLVGVGVDGIIVHNRSAWLEGLDPKQNRRIPPLKPRYSRWLKRDFPGLYVCANGEIDTVDQLGNLIFPATGDAVDGVMIGRSLWRNPWIAWSFSQYIESGVAACPPLSTRLKVLESYLCYVQQLPAPAEVRAALRPLSGFFHHFSGAKWWRKFLTESPEDADAIWRAAHRMVAFQSQTHEQ